VTINTRYQSSTTANKQAISYRIDPLISIRRIEMKTSIGILALFIQVLATATAYSHSSTSTGRRAFVKDAVATVATASSFLLVDPRASVADDEDTQSFETTESGLMFKVVKEGDGAVPSSGQTIKGIELSGILYEGRACALESDAFPFFLSL